MHIIAGIAFLIQYIELIKNKPEPEPFRPERCPFCGKLGVWLHGYYSRKADRTNSGNLSLNPILIHRFFCPDCNRTCSALPECIPPRRWYLWDMQQAALSLLLIGESLRATASKVAPSRWTIKRWLIRFQEQLSLHKDILCNHFVELGRAIDFADFWKNCFRNIPLSKAMYLCHASGVPVP